MEKTFTETEVITAICVWDEMRTLLESGKIEGLNRICDWGGVGHLRWLAANVGEWVEAGWSSLSEDQQDNGHAFDLEFVPAMVAAIDWTKLLANGSILLPEPERTARSVWAFDPEPVIS
jgi:hypothetical protein